MGTPSRLADLLREGHFVVTAELSSGNSPDPEATWRRAEVLHGSVDAINCTDNTGAHVHMSSLAAAHLLVLEALKEKERLIYNLGNGRGFSVREVIDTIRSVTGHAIPAQESPRRPGDPAVLVASPEKIKRELGWKPEYADLESMVRSAWEWHSKHGHVVEGKLVARVGS